MLLATMKALNPCDLLLATILSETQNNILVSEDTKRIDNQMTVSSEHIKRAATDMNFAIEDRNEEELATEAAFSAEAAAFARRYHLHELAVRRLVEDLVGEDESQVGKDEMERATEPHHVELSVHSGNQHAESTTGSSNSRTSKPMRKKRQSHLHGGKHKEFLPRSGVHPSPSCKNRIQPTTGLLDVSNIAEHAKLDVRPISKSSQFAYLKTRKDNELSSSPVPKPAKTPRYSRSCYKPVKIPKDMPLNRTHKGTKLGLSRVGQTSRNFIRVLVEDKLSKGTEVDNCPSTGSVSSTEHGSIDSSENSEMGSYLRRLAKEVASSGNNARTALDCVIQAAKTYEFADGHKSSLDFVLTLHVVAALHCLVGQFEEAVSVLKRSILVPNVEIGGEDHALAAFAGYMQLGDTLALLGRGEDALSAYHSGLEIQMKCLGDKDSRVGETLHYIAEAHAQAMHFDKAEEICQRALDIHQEQSAATELAADRRLMGLICNERGRCEQALTHLTMALATMKAHGKDADVASLESTMGDTYVALGDYREAQCAYERALTALKALKGESLIQVASVHVSLADLSLKCGKISESKRYCETALRLYNKKSRLHQHIDVANGLAELALVFEALNEHEQAISLSETSLDILETAHHEQTVVAGVEAQMGVLKYLHGQYEDARTSFTKAVSKLRKSGDASSCLLGVVLNQMGLTCVQLSDIDTATRCFEEASSILSAALGQNHPDTMAVYVNLAGAYDALGKLENVIDILQDVMGLKQEKTGVTHPEVEDERNRLAELIKEAGALKTRQLHGAVRLPSQWDLMPGSKQQASLMCVSVHNGYTGSTAQTATKT